MHLKSSLSFALSVLCLAAPAAHAQEVNQTIRISSSSDGPISVLPPGRTPKTGTGALRGRVVSGDSGSGVRRAQVRVSGPDIGTKTALTDNQGRYEFKDLPAGRFNVSVTKSGYVTMQYGQNRPFEPGRPIELADAQALDRLDVALPRGCVLAGRVVDETGEAVVEAEVQAMRMQFQNGKRRLVATGRNATTNDLGQFRLYGLPPGDYYVTASLRNVGAMLIDVLGPSAGAGPAGSNQTTGYASTYYPSTPNPVEAQRLAVAVGQELTSVDIQLQPVRLAKINGMALGSDGKPMSGAMVMLLPSTKDAFMMMPFGTSRTDKDGNFNISSVTPGDYTLEVQSSAGGMIQTSAGGNVMMFNFRSSDDASPQGNGSAQREFGSASLNVSGEDITGLVITGMRGAKASGTIKFAGTQPDGAANARISAPSTDADNGPGLGAGTSSVKDNGTFEIGDLVGGHTFRVANAPKGWVLKAVIYNGQDVTDTGIEFKPGQDLSDVEIDMTNSTQTVTGLVTAAASSDVVKDCTVVVFADDPQKWTIPQSRWMSSARPDQDGRYRVTSLPPGRYFAIAVDYVAQGDWQDPDWLTRASKKATPFTLDDGSNKTLDLKLAGG